jgi:hypothetical protein
MSSRHSEASRSGNHQEFVGRKRIAIPQKNVADAAHETDFSLGE